MVFNVKKVSAEVLKTKRILAQITQVQLANRSGVPQSRISLYENSDANLNESEKKKIMDVLGPIKWVVHNLKDGVYNMQMPKEHDGSTNFEADLAARKGLRIHRSNVGNSPPREVALGYEEDK